MSLVLDEVHVESLIDVVVEQLIIECSQPHLLELLLAGDALLLWSEVLGDVPLDTRKHFIQLLEVFGVMLQLWVEVPLEGDGRALLSRSSVAHVEWEASQTSHELVVQVTLGKGSLSDLIAPDHLWGQVAPHDGIHELG